VLDIVKVIMELGGYIFDIRDMPLVDLCPSCDTRHYDVAITIEGDFLLIPC
jgi:hypothetical protein